MEAKSTAVPPYGLPPYGVVIQQAIAGGDLAEMRKVEQQAESYLNQSGDVPAALAALRAEIAKAEQKR